MTYTTLANSNDGKTFFLRDTTGISPLMACLFGGHLSLVPKSSRIIEMDSWLPFYVKCDENRAVRIILEFRKALERVLTGAFQTLSSRKLLTDDALRESFAGGLIEVLNLDHAPPRKIAALSWTRDSVREGDYWHGDSGGVGLSRYSTRDVGSWRERSKERALDRKPSIDRVTHRMFASLYRGSLYMNSK